MADYQYKELNTISGIIVDPQGREVFLQGDDHQLMVEELAGMKHAFDNGEVNTRIFPSYQSMVNHTLSEYFGLDTAE
jgi:hypothetical protein